MCRRPHPGSLGVEALDAVEQALQAELEQGVEVEVEATGERLLERREGAGADEREQVRLRLRHPFVAALPARRRGLGLQFQVDRGAADEGEERQMNGERGDWVETERPQRGQHPFAVLQSL